MRLKPYHIIIYTLIILSTVNAKGQPVDVSRILLNLYDRVLFTTSDAEKVRLNDSVLLIIDSYAASDSIFEHKFSNLRFLGQVTSPDSRLKIITWNLVLRNGTNNYFCYIILKGKKGEKNQICKLKGKHMREPVVKDRIYSAENWYGALYYAIQPCRKDYILLGLDFSGMNSRKIIEVLSFTPEGEITFGKEFFIRGNIKNFREVLEYSSESVVSLRFNSSRLIVFDHLASFSTDDENNSKSMGAGLSFDGYTYKKGLWIFTSGIDARNPRK